MSKEKAIGHALGRKNVYDEKEARNHHTQS